MDYDICNIISYMTHNSIYIHILIILYIYTCLPVYVYIHTYMSISYKISVTTSWFPVLCRHDFAARSWGKHFLLSNWVVFS